MGSNHSNWSFGQVFSVVPFFLNHLQKGVFRVLSLNIMSTPLHANIYLLHLLTFFVTGFLLLAQFRVLNLKNCCEGGTLC